MINIQEARNLANNKKEIKGGQTTTSNVNQYQQFLNTIKLEFDEENIKDQALDQQQMTIGDQLVVLAQFKAEFKGDLSCNARKLDNENLNEKRIADILHVKDEEDQESGETSEWMTKLNQHFFEQSSISQASFSEPNQKS